MTTLYYPGCPVLTGFFTRCNSPLFETMLNLGRGLI